MNDSGESMQEDPEIRQAVESVAAAAEELGASVRPVSFGPLGAGASPASHGNLDLLLDVTIPVMVEIGRTSLPLREIVDLVPGSVVALDKKAEEPVDLRVNGKLVARGEVVLVDDRYGLRVTEIADAAQRLESLRAAPGSGSG
jgi:flagellar motor switch protein FliN/FliY